MAWPIHFTDSSNPPHENGAVRVNCMLDGQWITLARITAELALHGKTFSEAGVSARLRDLRKTVSIAPTTFSEYRVIQLKLNSRLREQQMNLAREIERERCNLKWFRTPEAARTRPSRRVK